MEGEKAEDSGLYKLGLGGGEDITLCSVPFLTFLKFERQNKCGFLDRAF